MGEMHVTREPTTVLTCLGLGSCIGLCLYDPASRVGAMAHIVLPDSTGAKGGPSPRYADTAVSYLLQEMARHGASTRRLIAKMAGGAQMSPALDADSIFRTGSRNAEATAASLASDGVLLAAADTGGHHGRTIRLFVRSGEVTVTTAGGEARTI